MTEEPPTAPPAGPQRPALVWVIVLWVVLTIVSSFVTLGKGLAGTLDGPPEITAPYRDHPAEMIVSTLISAGLQGCGALFLFHLRRVALWYFLGSAFYSLYLTFRRMESLKATGLPGEQLAVVVLTGMALQLAVCGYIWTLDRRGFLS